MGLEEIQKEIAASAEKEARAVTALAEAEAKKIVEAAEADVAAYQNHLLEKARQEAEEIKERGQVSARMIEERKLLSLKQGIVGKVFQGVLEKLGQLPHDEYEKLLTGALNNLKEARGALIPAAGREEAAKKVLAVLNREAGAGRESHLKMAENSFPGRGGFLIKGKTFDLDGSFESALEKLKLQLEPEVLKILFS